MKMDNTELEQQCQHIHSWHHKQIAKTGRRLERMPSEKRQQIQLEIKAARAQTEHRLLLLNRAQSEQEFRVAKKGLHNSWAMVHRLTGWKLPAAVWAFIILFIPGAIPFVSIRLYLHYKRRLSPADLLVLDSLEQRKGA